MNATKFAWILFALSAAPSPGGDWRAVTPTPGAPMDHPPLRQLSMIETKPTDLEVKVKFRGATQRYGELRLGPPSAIRIAVALDEISASEADLYVDANRDRVLEAGEKAAQSGKLWRVPLTVHVASAPLRNRTVVFRRRSSGGLSYAVAGYLEGAVALGGKNVAVRRVDGDGNGGFSDPQDYLWLDLNRDGVFDPLSEQHAFRSILTVEGKRYAVKSEPFGVRLEFQPIVGEGLLQLGGRWQYRSDEVSRCSLAMAGADGAGAVLEPGRPETAPIGEYSANTLHLVMKDKQAEAWSYVFSLRGNRTAPPHPVGVNGTTSVDPVGKLDFVIELNRDEKEPIHAGDELPIRLRLYTGDGLLINEIGRGEVSTPYSANSPRAEIRLTTTSGESLAATSSGFA